jgi:hypothetical protein
MSSVYINGCQIEGKLAIAKRNGRLDEAVLIQQGDSDSLMISYKLLEQLVLDAKVIFDEE